VLQDNQLRWNRLENLMREGSKSQDFDATQLWMLASWLLSENAAGVRAKLAVELARMLDAAAAADARDRIARRCGCCSRLSARQSATELSSSGGSKMVHQGLRCCFRACISAARACWDGAAACTASMFTGRLAVPLLAQHVVSLLACCVL
jgi:hypothetical protein